MVSQNPFARTDTATIEPSTSVPASPFANANSTPAEPAPMTDPFGNPDDVFEFDLSGATSAIGVPAGSYLLRLADLTKETSNNSGNPMWVFTFAVVQKADGSDAGAVAGRTTKKFCALTESALGILASTLEAIGYEGSGAKPRFAKSDALNRLCYGEVIDSTYQGRKTTSLQNLYPYEPAGAKWSPNGLILP